MPIFSYKTYLFLFLAGLLGTLFLTPPIRRVALRLKALDKPAPRKIHKRDIPSLGGLSVFVTFVLLVGSCMLFENLITVQFLKDGRQVASILLCGLIALILGIWDDLKGADARLKFSVQIGTAMVAFALGFQIEEISLGPWGSIELGMFSLPFTILWIVGITNAINIIDGLDGLAAGVTLFVCIGNFFVSLVFGKVVMSVISVILAGALLGFLRYNFPPARIFLGNTGSLFLGMVVALTSVLSAQKGPTMVMMLIPIAALGLPILDTSLAVFRRSLFGRPIFVSDKGHIHHALLRLGLSHKNAVLLLYGFCLFLLGFATVVLLDKGTEAAIYLGAIAIVSIIGMKLLGYLDYKKIREARSKRWRYRVKHVLCRLVLLKIRNVDSVNQLWKLLTVAAEEFEVDNMELSLNRGLEDSQMRWANGKNHEQRGEGQFGEWRSERFDFQGGLGCLRVGYHWSHDEDFEVERSYRLGVIAHAAEKRLVELVEVSRS